MNRLAPLVCLAFAIGFVTGVIHPADAAERRPNVLFLAFDDLKPLMGCYGDKLVQTPNMDRLAARGMVFLNAHCQQAVCAPTRASLLTGLRPDTTKVYDLKTRIRANLPDVVTLPQYFKQHGYETVGMGKIFDPRSVDGRIKDDPASWSRPYVHGEHNPKSVAGFVDREFVVRARSVTKEKGLKPGDSDALKEALGGFPPTEAPDVADEMYEDGELAQLASEYLDELSQGDKPFFLAVGFHKPHLPFTAPKSYWDLYDRAQLPLASFTTKPQGAPDIAYQDSWELKNGSYDGRVPREPGVLPEALQRELIHGYFACISFVDAQLGKVLDALDRSAAKDNTVIVLWGDHGWHLGDHGMWCKHTNYEQATRVPLLIARAGNVGAGRRSASPVEFVDIYPTLCALAGLPIPAELHGASLVPILNDPEAQVKQVARSQYPRGSGKNETMGYAYRDQRYRYVRWVPAAKPDTEPLAIELYDYETDPGETKNVADDPAYAAVLDRLQKLAATLK